MWKRFNGPRARSLECSTNQRSATNVVIETDVNYESGTSDVQSLSKHEIINGIDQGIVPDISYVVISGSEIMYGVDPADALEECDRHYRDTRWSFRPEQRLQRYLTTTVPNVVGYQKEEFSFNSDGLIAQDTVVLSEDGTTSPRRHRTRTCSRGPL